MMRMSSLNNGVDPSDNFLMSIVLPKLGWANEQVKDNEEEGDLAGGEDED